VVSFKSFTAAVIKVNYLITYFTWLGRLNIADIISGYISVTEMMIVLWDKMYRKPNFLN